MKASERPSNAAIVGAIVFTVLAIAVSGAVIDMDRECINSNGRLVDNGVTYSCELGQ